MRSILFSFLGGLLILLPSVITAHNGPVSGKYTKEKTIKREFDVAPDALLKIQNSYGNLNLTSWSENRILIEVHIKTSGNNQEKVLRKLDGITVSFEGTRTEVSARTQFPRAQWGWGGNSGVSMQVDYTIKLPHTNNVDLNNDYGGIVLDRLDGQARISCDYGRLDLGELNGNDNYLNFDYTSKSNIAYLKNGQIKADYSGVTIEKAGNLTLHADYTQTTIVSLESLQYSCDYGNLEVSEVKQIRGTGDYIGVKIGTLSGSLDINADYGSIRIGKVAGTAGDLKIRSNYTGIKIGYDSNINFDFDIQTSYGNFKGKDQVQVKTSNERSSQANYNGYYGSPGSGKTISIISNYGDISLNKN